MIGRREVRSPPVSGPCLLRRCSTALAYLKLMIVQLLLLALALALPLVQFYRQRTAISTKTPAESDNEKSEPKSVMQPPRDDLAPPKDDPITLAELKQYDGSDSSKPIYVAIKGASTRALAYAIANDCATVGTVFDVTRKADTYGPGKSYNLFAGKDASKALGMSSLKEEDAVSDYSGLSEADLKTLNDWHDFFSYARNITSSVAISHIVCGQETIQHRRKSIGPPAACRPRAIESLTCIAPFAPIATSLRHQLHSILYTSNTGEGNPVVGGFLYMGIRLMRLRLNGDPNRQPCHPPVGLTITISKSIRPQDDVML